MAVDEANAPPEAPEALSTEVHQDNNTTNPPIEYCALYATPQEENGYITVTIANIPVDVVPQTPRNPNLEETAPVNSPQQRKIEIFDSIEEDCTGGYNSDG